MRSRMVASIRGRPGCHCREIIAQWRRNRYRCHFATVSVFTITSVFVHLGQTARSATQKARSALSRVGLRRCLRSVATC
jgi:hypothetical protein